jgi:hypothetical protein
MIKGFFLILLTIYNAKHISYRSHIILSANFHFRSVNTKENKMEKGN